MMKSVRGMSFWFEQLAVPKRRLLCTSKEFEGAWCIRDEKQDWWKDPMRDTVDIISHRSSMAMFEKIFTDDICYEDSVVSIQGRDLLANYLKRTSSLWKVRSREFIKPPQFLPRLVGAERNVFGGGGHVPDQVIIHLQSTGEIMFHNLYSNEKVTSVLDGRQSVLDGSDVSKIASNSFRNQFTLQSEVVISFDDHHIVSRIDCRNNIGTINFLKEDNTIHSTYNMPFIPDTGFAKLLRLKERAGYMFR